jgi:branched-chain amino acid transport system substrate-binding protein
LPLLAVLTCAGAAQAEKRYDPGASDSEIKIGNIAPYSGPASPYAQIARTEAAYFNKVNAEGGINGRKIVFISYDDGYSPPKTFEQARKLVESDEVLLLFNPIGTAHNTAIQKYLNGKRVPHLFLGSAANKWNEPKAFPWTMSYGPPAQIESRIYAQYLLRNHPAAKIGILYQNDDFGRDYLGSLKDALGGRMQIIAELAYEPTDPTVDSQMVNLKASGADVFFNVATPKFAAQAIRKAAELNWKPVHILNNSAISVGSVLKPAGLEAATGILSTIYGKDPTDLTWSNDAGMAQWRAFMDQYFPEGDKTSVFTVYGYSVAQLLVHVLNQCGDDLTREKVMAHATQLRGFDGGMLLPGVTINTSPADYVTVKQMQMQRFNGERWELFGPILDGASN